MKNLNIFGILGLVFLGIAIGSFFGGDTGRGGSFLALGIIFFVVFGRNKKKPAEEGDDA